MPERSRRRTSSSTETEQSFQQPDPFEVGKTTLDLDDISDEELEHLYFEDDEEESSFFNMPTIAGLSLIVVGIVYLFTELGVWAGPDIGVLVEALPIVGGILIILLGFGVLTWRSSTSSNASDKKAAVDADTGKAKVVETPSKKATKKRLMRSRTDKKLMGVCGGIAEYLNLDPTLVRIAFVIGVIASGGPFVLAYFGLGFVMPKEPKLSDKERISIIRDS
jgi:phage shock protein C